LCRQRVSSASQGQRPARKRVVTWFCRIPHFRNALKCVGASGRLPSGNLQIKAVDCRILLRFVVLYYALFSAFGAASPFLPAFLAGRGLGAEELGVVVRQPQCDWFAVPLPGVSPTVSSSFEQNLPSGPEEVVTKIEKVK
jgi:hypothetical protein